MLATILLLLLTGLTWTAVGILFAKAPADRERIYTFFALNGAFFTFLVWLTRFPEFAPLHEILLTADGGSGHSLRNDEKFRREKRSDRIFLLYIFGAMLKSGDSFTGKANTFTP